MEGKMCKRFELVLRDPETNDIVEREVYLTEEGYELTLYDTKTGKMVPNDEWFVFSAGDKAVPAMLQAYIEECKRLEGSNNHIQAIRKLLFRIDGFQQSQPERCFVE